MATGPERDRAHRKRELEKLIREAMCATCVYCGEKVTMEDRCEDGLYLHRHCASKASALPAIRGE